MRQPLGLWCWVCSHNDRSVGYHPIRPCLGLSLFFSWELQHLGFEAGFVQAMEFWKNYGILKRKFHIWKNYGIWAKWPYLWKSYGIFVWVEKKCVLSFKNGGKIRPDFNVCCFGYHFTRPSSTNLLGYSASLSRVNTCWAVNIVRPLSRVRQQVLMS